MGVEDEFEEMRKIINRMLSDAVEGKQAPSREPTTRGFDRREAVHGEFPAPRRRYIVRTPPELAPPEPEVTEGENKVFVTWDLNSVPVSDLKVRVSGRLLLLETGGPRPFQRVVELPFEVEPPVRWTCRNGVFDLELVRRGG